MQETASRPSVWYWIAVGLLLVVGAGALYSLDQSSANYSVRARRPARGLDHEPTVEELAADFREFREEVAQLTPAEQQEVWQSLLEGDGVAGRANAVHVFRPARGRAAGDRRSHDRSHARPADGCGRSGRRTAAAPPADRRTPGAGPIREVSGNPDLNRPFAELSVEERLALRRDMWQDATQQAHAMRAEFYRLMSERRKARGLPEPSTAASASRLRLSRSRR